MIKGWLWRMGLYDTGTKCPECKEEMKVEGQMFHNARYTCECCGFKAQDQ